MKSSGGATAHFDNVCIWGRVSPDAYLNRGWTCSEYTIAKYMKNVKNDFDDEVKAMDGMRHWPETVDEYQKVSATLHPCSLLPAPVLPAPSPSICRSPATRRCASAAA